VGAIGPYAASLRQIDGWKGLIARRNGGQAASKVQAFLLEFGNTGQAGAVFQVYDKPHLDRIRRRYLVEASKAVTDQWLLEADDGRHDLCVYFPNGLIREFRGTVQRGAFGAPEVTLKYNVRTLAVEMIVTNHAPLAATLLLSASAYHPIVPETGAHGFSDPAT
jgi:phospholipase C